MSVVNLRKMHRSQQRDRRRRRGTLCTQGRHAQFQTGRNEENLQATADKCVKNVLEINWVDRICAATLKSLCCRVCLQIQSIIEILSDWVRVGEECRAILHL